MRCPHCGYEDSKVIDSRASEDGLAIRRRRECIECTRRFTTYERSEENFLTVIKSNGSVEPFDRAKLLRGLMAAMVKRGISQDVLESVIDDIEAELRNTFTYQVKSKALGDMVLIRLKKIDRVAYIRFASVYKDFKDLEEFTAELKDLS